ncbi:11386_t:CDS:2, partial [Gigaspora rosea]
NMYTRDPETQATFKKDNFYYDHFDLDAFDYFDRISALNKYPLKIALIGISQKIYKKLKI